MSQVITITDEVLTYVKDGGTSVILSKWVCDKHHDVVLIKNAHGGKPIDLGKITVDNVVSVDGTDYDNPTDARAAIGVNW